ncbi:hypothetical protein, partial [Rhizobium sp.]|uniref:hypothetical protein n=1 Tax=Rhizobium sp. TaxID=391 RepID=UPI002AA92DD3
MERGALCQIRASASQHVKPGSMSGLYGYDNTGHAVLRTDRAAMADGTLAADEVMTVGFATGGTVPAVIRYPVLEGAGGRQVAMADAE